MDFRVPILFLCAIAVSSFPCGFASSRVYVCNYEFDVFRFDLEAKCPPSLYPTPPIEVDGDSLDRLVDLNHGNAYMSVLFYASWCPFSRAVRPKFDMLSSMFPQVQHLAVEHSQALPSMLEKLWEEIQLLRNLKWMHLSYSNNLKELPDLSTATNLETLDLSKCTSLVELPYSIGNALNLMKLDLVHCSSLVKLPSSFGNMTKLQKLDLNNCLSLVELPSSIGNLINLEKVDLSHCSSLMELPYSIGNLINLEKLPSSVGSASNLEKLDLSNCSSLVELPSSIGNATNLCSISLEKLDLSNCSSLVELPSSIGNATNLRKLKLANCSSLLEVLLININMESLSELDLKDCPLLKSFPEEIGGLMLNGKATEEALSSMRQWYRLSKLKMSYCESLREFPHALNCITELHLSETEIKQVSPWVKGISRLRRFVLNGCRKLVSIPQLSDSLSSLHAENCESLERLDCSFHNPQIRLNFANCLKLNKDARALIIHTPTRRHVILPGVEVPACFTYQATGGSLIVKLNERSLPISLRFKACILPISNGDDDTVDDESLMPVYISIMDKQNCLTVPYRSRDHILPPPLTEHLYTFEIEAKVTAAELLFEFSIHRDNWEIGQCGVFKLMEVPCVHEHDVSSDSDIGDKH
ncbi:hypothetical protein AALP_AA3G032500 [Arabis alpina]|uniref:C-JID domain-containing protein n=1 Tax=Arabis alpina TaxID=50452 RepID=A0A087H6R0_ARAAL|nr:hypothetical protein AALP_AA3G032500 [Arabis alpina]